MTNIWKQYCKDIICKGIKAIFQQNPYLKQILIDTFPGILVETAPRDPLWGIGLGLQYPNIHIQHLWKGQHLLEYLLTDVRNELMSSA